MLAILTTSPPLPTAIHIEAYLTGKLRSVWPDALVVRVDTDGSQQFILRRPNHSDVVLASDFEAARLALYAVIRHTKAGGQYPG